MKRTGVVARGVLKRPGWCGRLLPPLLVLLLLQLHTSGCYNNVRGDPVDRYHYQHTITVAPDHSSIVIQTFLNRTHLRVGLRREALYDGDRDGELSTPGYDRVAIVDYEDVEAPPEAAEYSTGRIRDYADRFKEILEAVRSGAEELKLDDRTYIISTISQYQQSLAGDTLT
jgi:hypothetical protein